MRDCCKEMIAKIPVDEPIFILRAQDVTAPFLIANWCETATRMGVSEDKIAQATEHMKDVIEFQAAHPDRIKLPD